MARELGNLQDQKDTRRGTIKLRMNLPHGDQLHSWKNVTVKLSRNASQGLRRMEIISQPTQCFVYMT